jgi:hypothetical protein
MCNHQNTDHYHGENGMYDKFLYSVRVKRQAEAFITYANQKGDRIKSSFKKLENITDFTHNHDDSLIDYSSDIRSISEAFYEGIYPLDPDETDQVYTRYLEFVKSVHTSDVDTNINAKEYSIVFAKEGFAIRWLDRFIKKLEIVEKYLEYFAKGGDIYMRIEKDIDHDEMLKYILQVLEDNRMGTPEDDILQTNVRNMIIDPYLCDGEIYQIRYNKSLMAWHKNYLHVIKKYRLMPSRQFAMVIMNFSLADFFRQIQSKDNLSIIVKNIEDIYGIRTNPFSKAGPIRVMGNNNNHVRSRFDEVPNKFQRVIKTFNV